MKAAGEITDRGKRYRAQKNRPPGRKLCNFCANRKNVDVDHITGNESDGEPENLMYLCRPCNTTKGIVQKRNRIGIRTRQYNPAGKVPTFAQFKHAAAILLGRVQGDAGTATELIRITPPERRAAYAERIAKNPAEAPTLAQYAHAVTIHKRGAHDEGGKIIHATPPAIRSQYARQMAVYKRKRRAAARAEVPF